MLDSTFSSFTPGQEKEQVSKESEQKEELQFLLDAEAVGEVFDRFSEFTHLSHSYIATKIIDAHAGTYVADNLSLFSNLDSVIASRLVDAGYSPSVIQHHDRFDLTDDTLRILDKKIAGVSGVSPEDYLPYLNEHSLALFPKTFAAVFEKITTNETLAVQFIKQLSHYHQCPGIPNQVKTVLRHNAAAAVFLRAVSGNTVNKEKWIDAVWVNDVIRYLTDERGMHVPEPEELTERDPHEHHPWLFTEEQMQMTSTLTTCLRGESDRQKLERYTDNPDQLMSLLSELKHTVDTGYADFLGTIERTAIMDEDRNVLLHPAEMKPLVENIYAFAVRYLVQSAGEDISNLNAMKEYIASFRDLLEQGFKKYTDVHTVDVPLYDKLYDEFDTLRKKKEHHPLEVYVGRDGIYAYLGRRAQDVARRRMMGWEARKRLKAEGNMIAIHPKYIVYPRYFRDEIGHSIKEQFLRQEGITSDSDVYIFDTAYTGTILEQMLRIMGFSEKEIEKRIRLISTFEGFKHRRIKGISEVVQQEIVDFIESNAKLEKSAEGLMYDTERKKIRPVAEPTSPEEQFLFMMIKQAITRHYWLQERGTSP